MSRVTTTTRALEVELTPDELAEEAQKLAAAVEAVAKQEDALEEAKGLWSAKKKSMEGYLAHLKGDANALAAIVDTGKTEREVACTWLYHLGSGYAFLTRDDTGDLVTHRQLSDAERQTDLLEVLQEPTPEQFDAWVKELGLEVDLQLPLEELAFYATTKMMDPREDEPEDDREERVVLRFSGPEKSPEQLTGVAVLPVDDGSFMGTRDNGALTYSNDELVLQRAQASWSELVELEA